eukprot:CAMPEP_0185441766 /NCGR_PEP_ID=MMETSP1365-20130426/43219_1 /TAXON_ID=38817 /ORGANISM="Gephyrocapsa oceanica, Strain RCC1303" /LENGTH=148 /DNA_ID=CAMNT_0028047255 /DNA_START=42 /DNA_END=486 /DNA_ORIENTATION=+
MCPLSGRTAWKPPSPELRGEQRRHPADPFPLPLVESVGTLRDGDEHRVVAASPQHRGPGGLREREVLRGDGRLGHVQAATLCDDAANASPLGSAAEEGSRPLRSSGSTRTPPPPAASPGSAYSATALAAVWRRRVAAAHCARLEREAS